MNTTYPEPLKEATEALAGHLLVSEPFVIYERARTELVSDDESRSLLDKLSAAQNKLRELQLEGSLSQEEIDKLRELQDEVKKNPKFIEFERAQFAATSYLREINQEISQQLGMDFSAMVGRSCG